MKNLILQLARKVRNLIKEVLIVNIIGWVLVGILVVVVVYFPDYIDILFFSIPLIVSFVLAIVSIFIFGNDDDLQGKYWEYP